MKTVIISLCLLFSSLSLFAGEQELLEQGNALYSEGNYAEAVDAYNNILSTGMESGNLYFNLANAHYKNGSLVDAIINYERALLLKPQDKDIRYNLELANSQITDKIEPVGTFFMSKWKNAIRDEATSDFWAILGAASFVLVLMFIFLFVYSNSSLLKRGGFYVGMVFFFISIIGFSFAHSQKQKLEDRNYAIVVAPSLNVKSSPDSSGTEIFILHEGTKVEIISELGDWRQIQLADGNIGWVEYMQIVII